MTGPDGLRGPEGPKGPPGHVGLMGPQGKDGRVCVYGWWCRGGGEGGRLWSMRIYVHVSGPKSLNSELNPDAEGPAKGPTSQGLNLNLDRIGSTLCPIPYAFYSLP